LSYAFFIALKEKEKEKENVRSKAFHNSILIIGRTIGLNG